VRTGQIATILASLSIGGVVLLYAKVDGLERDLRTARAGTREARPASDPAADPIGDTAARSRGAGAPDAARGGHRATATAATMAASSTEPEELSIEDRVARLEQRQRTLEGGPRMPWHPGGQRPARSIDDLAQRLSLTATQRSRIEDAIGRGRQRIEDTLKIPDETGKSPYERRAEARKKLEDAMKSGPGSGGILAFATDLVSYQGKKIPGRGDTYGDEINRIRKETREEIASALDAKQQETLRDTNVDGLLGEASQVSFAYAVGDAGDDTEAGLVIEMESDVLHEVEGTPPAPDAAPREGR
jgi:hypothetical protein